MGGDVHNKLISISKGRNRFEEICSILCAAGNDILPESDNLGKIKSLMKSINQNLIGYAPIELNISINEQ